MPSYAATRRTVLLGSALATAGSTPLAAQIAPLSEAAATARANSGTVGVISGGVDGTYIRIAADLAGVLDDGEQLRVLPILGRGSVQNLADIIYLRGVDLGIVQADALAFVTRNGMLPGAANTINYVAKLYDEEVHVLARPDIARLEDLAGKPVNVDVNGSGTAMTAGLIFDKLNIPIEPTHDGQDVALQRLREGKIAAMVYVAGKPARLFTAVGAGSDLHFLPIGAAADLLDTYLPAQIGHDSYPNLVADAQAVETLAVGAVMAVYGWPPGTERHRRVVHFIAALTDKFARFQQPPRHPKWREVSLAAQVPGWTRFPAAGSPPPRPRGRTAFR
ncbi:MAG: hypothetical protein NVSMB18_08420 [Acetobacteraceae bacterium]